MSTSKPTASSTSNTAWVHTLSDEALARQLEDWDNLLTLIYQRYRPLLTEQLVRTIEHQLTSVAREQILEVRFLTEEYENGPFFCGTPAQYRLRDGTVLDNDGFDARYGGEEDYCELAISDYLMVEVGDFMGTWGDLVVNLAARTTEVR